MALQVIHTDRYGDLKVVQSFHEGPQVIHLLENGCYVFNGGLPIQSAKDLQKGVPFEFLKPALEWFEHKDDRASGMVREIKVLANNKLVFADDGSPVVNIEDVIAFYEPGPFRTAALEAFAENLAKEKAAKLVMPQGPKKPAVTDERRARMQKLNEAKAKKARAAKAAASAPPAQEAAAG